MKQDSKYKPVFYLTFCLLVFIAGLLFLYFSIIVPGERKIEKQEIQKKQQQESTIKPQEKPIENEFSVAEKEKQWTIWAKEHKAIISEPIQFAKNSGEISETGLKKMEEQFLAKIKKDYFEGKLDNHKTAQDIKSYFAIAGFDIFFDIVMEEEENAKKEKREKQWQAFNKKYSGLIKRTINCRQGFNRKIKPDVVKWTLDTIHYGFLSGFGDDWMNKSREELIEQIEIIANAETILQTIEKTEERCGSVPKEKKDLELINNAATKLLNNSAYNLKSFELIGCSRPWPDEEYFCYSVVCEYQPKNMHGIKTMVAAKFTINMKTKEVTLVGIE